MASKIRSLQSIDAEIERTQARVGELNARLKELDRQRKLAEDAEIVTAIRSGKISYQDYTALTKRYGQGEIQKGESTNET